MANQVNSLIRFTRPMIFDFDYPIFDVQYKEVLETKIIRHFYFRNICETPYSKWKFFLEDKMNIIMPYFNQLYESEKLAFNPLITVDYNRKFNRTSDSNEKKDLTNNSTTNQTVDNTNVTDQSGNLTDKTLDTPQNNINGLLENKYITDLNMSDSTAKTTDTGNTTSTGTGNSTQNSVNKIDTTEDYIESITGKNTGESYSKLIMEFRDSFLNIDSMIIKELNPLFFGLYGGDY